jgi:hypothetical protein
MSDEKDKVIASLWAIDTEDLRGTQPNPLPKSIEVDGTALPDDETLAYSLLCLQFLRKELQLPTFQELLKEHKGEVFGLWRGFLWRIVVMSWDKTFERAGISLADRKHVATEVLVPLEITIAVPTPESLEALEAQRKARRQDKENAPPMILNSCTGKLGGYFLPCMSPAFETSLMDAFLSLLAPMLMQQLVEQGTIPDPALNPPNPKEGTDGTAQRENKESQREASPLSGVLTIAPPADC